MFVIVYFFDKNGITWVFVLHYIVRYTRCFIFARAIVLKYCLIVCIPDC